MSGFGAFLPFADVRAMSAIEGQRRRSPGSGETDIGRASPLEHDAEKWLPLSRLREALGTVRRLA